MNITLPLLAAVLICCSPDNSAIGGTTEPEPDMFVPEGYTLLWNDEFEGTTINTAYWNTETGTGAEGWGNAELQYYTSRPENGTQDRYLNGACHWGESYADHTTYDYSLQDGKFHTYTCVWDEEYIRMYVDLETHPDAAPYFEMKILDNMGNSNCFRKECFLLLNLAVGGNFPGIHDIDGVTALASGGASMYVDYVRVFRKD